jgi:hypothetical protein
MNHTMFIKAIIVPPRATHEVCFSITDFQVVSVKVSVI